MRESSFVCCCLRMSTFWVNYSVSVIYCSNPALLWVSGRSPYACMQPIFSGCFQRWLCFHTTILYLSIFISENISQHLFSYCSSSYGLWKNYNPTHVTSSPQHPPHSMELLPKALPEVTHRSSEHLETVLHLSAMTGKPTRGTSL